MTDIETDTARQIASDWEAVAEAWDAKVDDAERPTEIPTAALLAALAIQPGDRVLELAAGPGALGRTWSELVGPTGSALLTDIAPGMVDAARRRNAGLANLEFDVVDQTAIERPDEAFDVVASRMGLMFSPDPDAALVEARRVLAAGGRYGALTWGALEHNPWLTCVGMAAMMNGLVTTGPPIGPGGVLSLGDPARLADMVSAAGFTDVTVAEIDVTFEADDIDEHLSRVGSLAGGLAGGLNAASADELAAVRRTAGDLSARYVTDSGLKLPGRAVLVIGKR